MLDDIQKDKFKDEPSDESGLDKSDKEDEEESEAYFDDMIEGKNKSNKKKKIKTEKEKLKEEKRNKKLINKKQLQIKREKLKSYYSGNYFGMPSCYVFYKIASKLNLETPNLLWLSIIGSTDSASA